MVNLRQRHLKQAHGDGKCEPLVSGDKCVVGPKSAPLSYRACIFLASVAMSCAAFLLYYNKQQRLLPESYVLCSRTGNQIYTVDDVGSRVQCLAVHNSQIVATGSLGELPDARRRNSCVTELTRLSDEVKEHWNAHDFTVPIGEASGKILRPPLSVRYSDEGSIVVPGMSGMPIPYPKYLMIANHDN
jgi:hypothetical protein